MKKNYLIVISVIIVFVLLGYLGYRYYILQSYRNSKKKDIRGKVQSVNRYITNNTNKVNIFVKVNIESDTNVDSASITIDSNTIIDNSAIDKLAENDKVEVIFRGPVLDSYPVQATAAYVKVIN